MLALLTLAVATVVGFAGTWLALKVREDIRRRVRDAYIAGLLEGVESMNRRWVK